MNLSSFCNSNGFSLGEYPLEGRLLAVLLNPKIVVKDSLGKERKEVLVKKAVSYLLNRAECRLVIFWEGKDEFLPL